jgi:hypothetical protein
MASLIHGELETIADGTRHLAAVQARGVAEMQAGFNQMSGAVDHLAWVQQQASRAQLDAQFRLMQLQSVTNDMLEELRVGQDLQNQVLIHVTSQLDGIAELLKSISDSQTEHLQTVKAERMLKEVLFQLSNMVDDMIQPDDLVAKLALSQIALDELDQHGLGTSHLSDLEDKKTFSNFVKTTKKQVRDTPPEDQSDLGTFETWYKEYCETRKHGLVPFVASSPPEWAEEHSPAWKDAREPKLDLLKTPEEPTEVIEPGNLPIMPPRTDMPEQDIDGRPYLIATTVSPDTTQDELDRVWGSDADFMRSAQQSGYLVILNPDNGKPIRSADNVPTAKSTKTRFPDLTPLQVLSGGGRKPNVMAAAGTIMGTLLTGGLVGAAVAANAYEQGKKRENARNFEQALRDWSLRVKQYESYLKAVDRWEKQCVEVDDHNAKEKDLFPKRQEEFRAKEQERQKEFQEDLKRHEAKEQSRRSAWEESARTHELEKAQRLEEWKDAIQRSCDSFKKQGILINEFLDEHPDLQLIYRKVLWERDLADITRRLEEVPAQSKAARSEQSSAAPEKSSGVPEHSSREAESPEEVMHREAVNEFMEDLIRQDINTCECPICQMEVSSNCLLMHYDFFHAE